MVEYPLTGIYLQQFGGWARFWEHPIEWDKAFGSLFAPIALPITGLIDTFYNIGKPAGEKFRQTVGTGISDISNKISGAVSNATKPIKDLANTISNTVKDIGNTVKDIGKTASDVGKSVTQPFQTITTITTNLPNQLQNIPLPNIQLGIPQQMPQIISLPTTTENLAMPLMLGLGVGMIALAMVVA